MGATCTATHNQASEFDFPLWADAEAKGKSQWLRKATKGGIMPPVDPVGQTPALLLSPGLPGVKILTSKLQEKEASYTDAGSYNSF